jgi:hypothetical protein
MFRFLLSHLQVVVFYELRNLLLVVFRSFLVLHLAIASVVVCLVSLELVSFIEFFSCLCDSPTDSPECPFCSQYIRLWSVGRDGISSTTFHCNWWVRRNIWVSGDHAGLNFQYSVREFRVNTLHGCVRNAPIEFRVNYVDEVLSGPSLHSTSMLSALQPNRNNI